MPLFERAGIHFSYLNAPEYVFLLPPANGTPSVPCSLALCGPLCVSTYSSLFLLSRFLSPLIFLSFSFSLFLSLFPTISSSLSLSISPLSGLESMDRTECLGACVVWQAGHRLPSHPEACLTIRGEKGMGCISRQ